MEEIPLDPPTTDSGAINEPVTETAEATDAVDPPVEVVLSAEEQAHLEILRKRAERFGTALNIPENFKKTPKQTPPRNEARKEARKEIEESERKKVEDREKRFGIVATKMRNDKHFDERMENPISEENKPRLEALHLYGVDFLTTENIMGYFKAYNPNKLEWLNDSSCNMLFPSANLAQSAYKELTLTKKYDSTWRETFPIEKEGLKFTLEVRFATEKDVKDPNRKEKSSLFYGFMFEQIKERKEKNKGNRRDRDRDYYDRGSGVRNKKISKKGGKRGKKTKEDEEEENDPELKKLRQEQAAEAQNEADNTENVNQATGEENGTQNNQVQQSTEAVQATGTTKESQDQDLDL